MRARLHAVVLLAALLAVVARGDVVHLKDGTRVSGEILSRGPRLLRVKDDRGKIVTIRVTDVDHIDDGEVLDTAEAVAERDAPFMPGLSAEQRKAVRARAATYAGPLGTPLDAAARKRVWVFGDLAQAELSSIADAVQRTHDDFCDTFGCAEDAPLESSDAAELTVFVFRQEPQYLRFIDRVFEGMRDATVDDARLALMKRQSSFWVLTPRPLAATYQGPGTVAILISNAAHRASHALLLSWKPAGAWMPWWLLEGFASWQEIRLTGQNLTYCLEVARPGDYAKQGTPGADEAAKAALMLAWRREVKTRVQARDDRGLGALARLSLNELEHPEVQESWSVVDWLSRTGKLREFVLAYKEERTLEAACATVFKRTPDGVHELWRRWVLGTY